MTREGLSRQITTIVITFLCTIALTFLFVNLASRYYPPLLRFFPVEIEASHLRRLRWNYDPFVFSVKLVAVTPESRGGFFKLTTYYPLWYYQFGVANLSHVDVADVDIRIRYRGKGYVNVAGGALNMRTSDGTAFPAKKYKNIIRDSGEASMILPTLVSGQGRKISISIQSASKPQFDDLEIFVRCEEGQFTRITPTQWTEIGWED